MSGWRETKLGKTGSVITGKTPSKDNPEDWGNEVLFVTPSDYKNYRKKAYSSIRMLSKAGADRQKNRLLPPGSILVTCIGSDMGKTLVNALPCVPNQQINAIIPDSAIADGDYLYYVTVDLYGMLRNFGGDGTAVPILNKSDFENIDILLPLLPEQKAIAAVLSSLDDKIDLLHRQNKTLEAMAETLFRQWFIEEAQADWEESTIGDVLDTVLGGTPSTKNPEFWDGGVPWINSGEVNNFRITSATKYISEIGMKKSNTSLLPKGTTVIAITGATLGQVSLLEIETCANQSVVGVIPNDVLPKEYVFLWVKSKINEIALNETGGAQAHINKNDINSARIIIPPKNILADKMPLFTVWFGKITFNVFQIQALEKLRDTLLPKLMSGEVRVAC
jgi:type I restriction enzyme S subunit